MGNLTIATIFIAALNILMWFSTIAMLNINPVGTFCYNTEGSLIASATTTNISTVNNDIIGQLPSSDSAVVTAGSTNIFTDIFNNVIGWFKSTPGIKYVYGVVAAPYNILKCMNLPNEFVVGIGTLWYLVSFLILIAFIWGRD